MKIECCGWTMLMTMETKSQLQKTVDSNSNHLESKDSEEREESKESKDNEEEH